MACRMCKMRAQKAGKRERELESRLSDDPLAPRWVKCYGSNAVTRQILPRSVGECPSPFYGSLSDISTTATALLQSQHHKHRKVARDKACAWLQLHSCWEKRYMHAWDCSSFSADGNAARLLRRWWCSCPCVESRNDKNSWTGVLSVWLIFSTEIGFVDGLCWLGHLFCLQS